MSQRIDYYDALAQDYHLLYRDWEATLEREGLMLRHWFKDRQIVTVLDASCGTGTQAIALAQIGYRVLAADPSGGMLEEARRHATLYDVSERIHFMQMGFLELSQLVDPRGELDAIVTKGNAFPHLITDAEIEQTLHGFYRLLRSGGTLLIGMKDFEPLIQERPRFLPGRVHDPEDMNGEHVVTFEIWDWDDDHTPDQLIVTTRHFIVRGSRNIYQTRSYPILYRALTADEVEVVLLEAGFTHIERLYDRAELVMIATKP